MLTAAIKRAARAHNATNFGAALTHSISGRQTHRLQCNLYLLHLKAFFYSQNHYNNPVVKQASSSRFKILSHLDRLVGVRIIYIRRADEYSQQQMADMLKLTLAQMANIESGRVSLRLLNAWLLCRQFAINPEWLATGQGNVAIGIYPGPEWEPVEKFVTTNAKALFRDNYEELGRMVLEVLGKTDLTELSLKSNNAFVKSKMSEIEKLIEDVKRKAQKPGARAELARELGVAPARISEWLSGKKEPGGDYALRLQKWVKSLDHQN